MRVVGSTTPAVQLRREEPIPGGWLTTPAPETRDRVGRQAISNMFGDFSSPLAYATRSERLLTSAQLWRVYQRVPDVRAAVDGIVRRVSTWDWIVEPVASRVYDTTAQQVAEECTRFLNVPNQNGETWQEVIQKVVLDMLVYDVGVIEHVFNTAVTQDGRVTVGTKLEELTALRGCNIHQVLDTHGKLLYYVQDEYVEGSGVVLEPSMIDQKEVPGTTRFEPRQITFMPLTPNTTTPEAVPLIEAIVNEVITIMRSSEHQMLAMDADEIPPGILVLTGIAGKSAETAKADLSRMRGKDHKIRVITNADPQATGAKWVELRRTAKDVDFVNVVKEIRRTIWRVFGVMPVEMGASEDVPRSVGQVQLDVSASHLIGPLLELLENKVNARILSLVAGSPERARMVQFRFDREAKLTPAEEQARSQAIRALVDGGVLTRNEARRRMGEQPVEGGDVVTLTTGQGVILLTDIAGITGPRSPEGGGSPIPEPITPQSLYPDPSQTASAARVGVERAVGDIDPTNFPKAGDDLKVSLRNSEYVVFDPEFAEDLKQNWPQIWRRGGNIRGNEQYRKLKPVVARGGVVETRAEEGAVRLREAWSARHYADHRLSGVVALIKWFTVGEIGESEMKAVINAEKKRLSQERERSTLAVRALPSEWQDGGLFDGYRTLDLEELSTTMDEYSKDVESYWEEATAALLLLMRRRWTDGGFTQDAAQRLSVEIGQEIDRLRSKWSLGTSKYYRRVAEKAASKADKVTGETGDIEVVRQQADIYHQQAIGWLVAAGGVLSAVQSRMLQLLPLLTRGDSPIAEFSGENGLAMAQEALIAPMDSNEFRISNWSGKLGMLANQTYAQRLQEAGTILDEKGLRSAEWWAQWVAVGDDRTCSICRTESLLPIRPVSQFTVMPGGDTDCGARCRCVLVYWTQEEVSSGEAETIEN